jgi:two-component system sensor histidine kinase GlrK
MNDIASRSRGMAQGRFDSEVARLQHRVEQARTALIALTGAVITAALLAALAFARLINRPMRQITASIDALGRADLDSPVRVSGPRDLQAIGVSLDWLRERIRDLEAQKSTFVRHMSHELKSPLANIRAGIDLLNDESGEDPDRQEIAAIVERNASRLQRQIDDLLRYAGWQDAQPPQLPETVRLRELMVKSLQDQEFEARSRNIDVRTDMTPVSITAQESQVRAIVDNLISNAIKYSPKGGVVDVRLRTLGDSALIEVEDEGPGIPAELRERVFEPFFRGPDVGTSAGTGIGLSLALTAARSHGGSIRILDKDSGAHVQVALPLEPPA